jgi:hypothetical protein
MTVTTHHSQMSAHVAISLPARLQYHQPKFPGAVFGPARALLGSYRAMSVLGDRSLSARLGPLNNVSHSGRPRVLAPHDVNTSRQFGVFELAQVWLDLRGLVEKSG